MQTTVTDDAAPCQRRGGMLRVLVSEGLYLELCGAVTKAQDSRLYTSRVQPPPAVNLLWVLSSVKQ